MSSTPETETDETAMTFVDAEHPGAVAVVGMGLAVIGASDPEEFWRNLEQGPLLFSEAEPDRWWTAAFSPGRTDVPDKGYQPLNGLITGFRPHPELAAEGVDAGMDFGTRWLRHSLYQAMDGVARRPDDKFAFSVGLTVDGSQHFVEHEQIECATQALNGPSGDHLTTAEREQAGQALGALFPLGTTDPTRFLPQNIACEAIRGILPEDTPAYVVDTACSSSIHAVDRAVREIHTGRADIAACGGALVQTAAGSVLFAKLGGLTMKGEVRSLDEGADGTLFSDGAGIIVLKTLERARADGDRILGLISGVGLSCDGKGKAINAPASQGQLLASRRALSKASVTSADIDLIVSHTTATPVGDISELRSIAELFGDHPTPVTVVCNKSIVGHTGWAAGVVSIIHALLCLQHDVVPPQHRFVRLPEVIRNSTSVIQVPIAPVPWPPTQRRRRVLVSSFGFGGTNAVAVVSEHRPDLAVAPASRPGSQALDAAVIVGWSELRPQAGADFGQHYPLPPFEVMALPPRLIRNIDRGQVMAVQSYLRLPASVRDFCAANHESVGVIAATFGPTRQFQLGRQRVHLDDVAQAVGGSAGMRHFLDKYRAEIDDALPEINPDTYPGAMPNLIASRVANRFDFRGLNLLIDSGEASLLRAFDTAAAYLGDLTMALVVAVNANTLPAWLRTARSDDGRAPGEAAFMFAVTRRSTARAAGLAPLAFLDGYLESQR